MIICHIKHQTKFKKIIGTEKFNDTKILIDSDHKLSDCMTCIKNVMILMTCFIMMPINIIQKSYSQKKHCMLNKYLEKRQKIFSLMKSSINFLIFYQRK